MSAAAWVAAFAATVIAAMAVITVIGTFTFNPWPHPRPPPPLPPPLPPASPPSPQPSSSPPFDPSEVIKLRERVESLEELLLQVSEILRGIILANHSSQKSLSGSG